MTASFAEQRIKEIVAEQLGLGEEDVSLDAHLAADLGADILDIMEVIMAVEEEFELEIDDATADRLQTVADLVDRAGMSVQ